MSIIVIGTVLIIIGIGLMKTDTSSIAGPLVLIAGIISGFIGSTRIKKKKP